MDVIKTRNELLAQTIIKGINSRNMTGYYAHSKEEACKLALELIPEGSVIGMGGSATVAQIGLLDIIKHDKYFLVYIALYN